VPSLDENDIAAGAGRSMAELVAVIVAAGKAF
jgi:hypothetical protein